MNRFIISLLAAGIVTALTGCAKGEDTKSKPKKLQVDVVFAESCPTATEVKSSRCISDMGLQVVCAYPDDTIEWRLKQGSSGDFSIEFPGADPCKEKKKKECKVKDKDHFTINAGEFVKYDVEADGCEPLDPYIIVMR